MNTILVLILYFTTQVTIQTDTKSKISTNSINATSSTTVTNDISTEYVDDATTTVLAAITEKSVTIICEDNSSCFIPTENPKLNLSILIKNDTENIDTSQQQDLHVYKTSISTDYCTCNLQRNFCDINCCCDEDCTVDDKSIFHYCEPENIFYDTRYCEYMKYIYVNNTPFQWYVNQNGLFCIVKSNFPPSYTVQRKHPLTSIPDAELEKSNKFSWHRNYDTTEFSFDTHEMFVYGSNIWMVSSSGIKTFKLPKNFISGPCLIKEAVINLKNLKNICSQTDISEENKALSLSTYFQNVSIIATPNLVNFSRYKNFFQDCPRNICLPIFSQICGEHFSNCKNVSNNNTILNVNCIFHIRNNTNYCKNIVKKLQYNFYHKGTKGFAKIELLAILDDISIEFEKRIFEYYQEFVVNFWWINQTTNFSAMLSGNPGYIIGKPILIGQLINKGNETKALLKIERFPNDYLKTFMALPKNVDGKCILNANAYLTVEFGYNLLTKCKHIGIIINRKKYFNASEICKNLQKSILDLWSISAKNKTVGMFGNADANNLEDWNKILYKISLAKIFNTTKGKFNSANTSLICLGLVTDLIVDIYHSRIDFEHLKNQEKILGVAYTLGGFVNQSFSYNKKKNSTYFEINLETQVVFYDISRQKHRKFVDPPSLEIKLPYDFFYPFVKIENGVNIVTANFLFNLYLYSIVVLI